MKILSVDSVSNEILNDADRGLAAVWRLPPGEDAQGGTLSASEAADGRVTMIYRDSEGTATRTTLELPEDFELEQTIGVPLGADADSFLLPISADVEDFDAFGVNKFVKLIEVTINEDKTAEITVLEDAPAGMTFGDGSELYALGGGRIAMFNKGAPLFYPDVENEIGLLSAGEAGLVFQRLLSVRDLNSNDTIFVDLPDGGLAIFSQFYNSDKGAWEYIVGQFDADGVELGQQIITDENLDALGAPDDTDSYEVDYSEDGELVLYLGSAGPSEIDFADTQRIVIDLYPVQSDEPGVILPETPDGDYFVGEEGGEILTGTNGSDYFDMGDGDDVVRGQRGNDHLDLEDGDDIGFGGDGRDYLAGEQGNDTLFGGNDGDGLYGGDGADDARGGSGSDIVIGDGGADFLRGNRGSDEMYGDAGNDDMNGGFGDDAVFGGEGDDKVSGFDGSDALFGGAGNDVMHGGRGDDTLTGDQGDDLLRGAQGDDTLIGGAGDDSLIGGEGNDVFSFDLYEEQSIDTSGVADGFGIVTPADPVLRENGTDTIKDFVVGEDKIALDSSILVLGGESGEEIVTQNTLTYEDLFLSQEDSVAVIQAGDTTIRMNGVDMDDLSEDDFLLS